MEHTQEIAWAEAPAQAAVPISAAKLHVLQLESIQARLGPRWPRLSALVHKLFEKALSHAQGPRDHFLKVDALCYIATFHGLAADEAGLACAAVAKEVCELLFGEDNEGISLRVLTADWHGPLAALTPQLAREMTARLEQGGNETIVSRKPRLPLPKVTDWLAAARDTAAKLNRDVAFYPLWNLEKHRSQCLTIGLEAKPGGGHYAGARRALGACDVVGEMEIILLRAAAHYGARIAEAGRVCPIASGVSYDSLTALAPRIRVIQTLKSLHISQFSPLFVMVQQIPDGTPLGRLAEIVSMIAIPGVRVLLEFDKLRALPPLDIRLGVSGIGGVLPDHCDALDARALTQLLKSRAGEQKAFAFLEGVDSKMLAEEVSLAGLRFGAGHGFDGGLVFSGTEAVPALPLAL